MTSLPLAARAPAYDSLGMTVASLNTQVRYGTEVLFVTDDQLHSTACIRCGAREGLAPAGHAYVKDGPGRLGWAVVACPEHAEAVR